MIILGIDTSCDDTAISILKIQGSKSKIQNVEVLSNIVSSQVKLHAKYGGVYPSLAKREHIKNLPLVFRRAVKGIKLSEIDYIAVTNGPGLEPCLWQGVNFAKELAQRMEKPLISVNHIEAHIIANFIGLNPKSQIPITNQILNPKSQNLKLFPAICLVVSGGHTQLILIHPHTKQSYGVGVKDIGKYQLIGETRDDAAGECFDKTARILGLGYPGGPAVAEFAHQALKIKNLKLKISLPRPMMYTKDYDFSFSGLKTAVLYEVKKLKTINYKLKTAFCAEIQQAIVDVLIHKTLKAAKDFKAKSIILGGGVTANQELRRQFQEKIEKEAPETCYLKPETYLCTDNAAMVALTAYFHRKEAKKNWKNIQVDANLKI